MTVNYEIKSQLAKLLATEDLVVENRDVDTAQFNVGTRVLTLPLWKRASNTVYDLLVGHEVGHALFTPDEDWTEKIKVPQQFVNVCEDARIEKLMKRKYPGLGNTHIFSLHQLLNPCILTNIHKLLRNLNLLCPILIRCKECMCNLMTNQHIIYIVTCLLPYWKGQHTSMDIKLCCGN